MIGVTSLSLWAAFYFLTKILWNVQSSCILNTNHISISLSFPRWPSTLSQNYPLILFSLNTSFFFYSLLLLRLNSPNWKFVSYLFIIYIFFNLSWLKYYICPISPHWPLLALRNPPFLPPIVCVQGYTYLYI